MTPGERLTASRISLAMRCPSSMLLPHLDVATEAADRGTAIHAYLEQAGDMGRDAALEQVPDEYREVCAAIDLERLPVGLAAEVAFAYDVRTSKARELGRGMNRDYSSATPCEIPGTADVAGVSSDAVFVGDYKTGRSDIEPAKTHGQVRFLALAAARTYGRDHAVVEIIRIRENGFAWRDRAEMDWVDLDEIADEMRRLHDAVTGPNPPLRAGPWCRYCPAFAACPAQTALIRRLVDGTEAQALEQAMPLTPEVARMAYERWKAASELLKRVGAALHAYAKQHPIPLDGFRVFGELCTEGNEKLDGDVVWRVLAEKFGPEVADTAVKRTATKKGLSDALRPTLSDPRSLAKTERQVLEAVRARGGASRTMTTKITEYEATPAEDADPVAP